MRAAAGKLWRAIESLEGRALLAAHIVGSPTVYSTIQAAVNAASAGATINVDAGTYPELVTIGKSLTLRGAQAGMDGRLNPRRSGANESIVTGSGTGINVTSAFYINANDVTIDGFTVQGNTSNTKYGAGIVIAPNKAGAHIYNNVIQNNVSGIFLANNSTTDAAIIQQNAFLNNNNAGENGGRGIYSDSSLSGGKLTNVLIDANVFLRNFGGTGTTNLEAAISLEAYTANSQSNIRITNNVMDSNGKGVLMWNASNVLIQNNFISNARDSGSGALRFEGGDSLITIQNNQIYDCPGAAIRIDNKATDGDNKTFTVTGSNIYHNGLDAGRVGGLVISAKQYVGTMNARGNFWGSASGPSGDGAGTGDPVVASGTAVDFSNWSTLPVFARLYPYWGAPSVDGQPIQAEDFDHGGEGVAYHDSPDNDGGRYRPYENVDIETTTDSSGAFDVFSTNPGEYLAYTVNISQTGSYAFNFRVANGQSTPGKFHIDVDGANVSGAIAVPNTGGSQVWQTMTKTDVLLPAGLHVMKLVMDTGGTGGEIGNFNWFQFTYAGVPTAPAAPSGLAATPVSPTQINLVWTNNANNQTGFNIDRSIDGVTFLPLSSNVAGTSYSDSGLSAATMYYYRVRATNLVGDSANSNTASATTLPATSTPTYLSDLPWVSATSGYKTVQRDKTINGNPITLGGVVYNKGIGTHAVSTIVYKLGGLYDTFVCDVGVDDEVNGKGVGSVIFQVIGDGKVLFDSGIINNAGPSAHIAISVAGVNQLSLVANNGVPNSIDYDHADWAGAQLFGAPTIPAAPSNLTASAVSGSQINLTWQNNATNNTGLAIDRSTDGVTFVPLTTVAAGVSSYSDLNLTGSTTYSYRVRATSGAGSSPASNVASATTFPTGQTLVYLSDIPWVSATSGWGTTQLDASIKGNPITLRGTTYAKGIGTHADSTITYNLAGQYATFISDIGIDDEVGGHGSVRFQVIGDGKVLFDSGALTGASPVVTINISVAGVQQLQLVAVAATPGNIDYAHADWAGAQLVKNLQ